jgi:hypothetical protein
MSAVLILAYRRWQNMDTILDACRAAKVTRIFVHIDAGTNVHEKEDVARTLERASSYKAQWGMDIRIATQTKNIGCAVSMILSLNTIFSQENQVIVLEDDCIPTPDFFRFAEESFQEMGKNPSIGISCGAQFAPPVITGGQWLLSQYPFNWGWGITKSNWILLTSMMTMNAKLKHRGSRLSRQEIAYWNAGARRALDGYVDVWDTLIVREMIRHKLYSVLPGKNLVRNIGNDANALHTKGNQLWTDYPTGSYASEKVTLNSSIQFDGWARSQFFRISRRHLFSTRITWLLDFLITERKRERLRDRIQLAFVNFDK